MNDNQMHRLKTRYNIMRFKVIQSRYIFGVKNK